MYNGSVFDSSAPTLAEIRKLSFAVGVLIHEVRKLGDKVDGMQAEMKSNYIGYEAWAKQVHADSKPK